jgi:hypothetical protein
MQELREPLDIVSPQFSGAVPSFGGRAIPGPRIFRGTADQLDYVVRRWLTSVPFEEGIRSIPNTEASIRRIGLSSDIRNAIGRCLRAKYTIDQSMPARLADLLREFERQNNKSETIVRDGHPGLA